MDDFEVLKERARENLSMAAQQMEQAERDTLHARHANDSTAAALQALEETHQQLHDLGQPVDTSTLEETQRLAHIAEASYLESKKTLEAARQAYEKGVHAFVEAFGEQP